MPSFRVSPTARPTSIRAFQLPSALGTPLPGPLWYEGGVLWILNSPGGASVPYPIAFSSTGSFSQCVKANFGTTSSVKINIGAGPYGAGFQVASWPVKYGAKPYSLAVIATTLSSQSIIRSFLTSAGWPSKYAGLAFPASSFISVTAGSPAGNVTLPMLPLILVLPSQYTGNNDINFKQPA